MHADGDGRAQAGRARRGRGGELDYHAWVPRSRAPGWFAVCGIALAAAVFRAAAFSGTELYSDEAYYWLWSLRPAAGYYDHPPLAAWLIAAGTPLVRGELGVRLLFLACGAATVVFAALLARELSDDARAPVWAALLCAAAPLLNVLGVLALPDAPLVAAYTAALWLLARARGRGWLWVGAAAGVALLAKYTAALLAPALVVLAIWDGELRRELRTRWPWLAAGLALAIFAPCLLWNAQHGWASIRFQVGHGFSRNGSVESFLQYVAGQVAGAGPVALVCGVAFLVRADTAAAKRVAAGALVPLAITTWSALRGRVEANWPALVYPALAAAASAWAVRLRPGTARALVAVSAGLAVALLGGFALEQRHPRWLAGTAAIERFHGWRALADDARTLAAQACRDAGCDASRPFLVTANYQYAAELAYYGGFRRLGPAVERPTQLDVWGARPAIGEPFLFVGFDGVTGDFRRTIGAGGEGPTLRATVSYRGVRLRSLTVTPFAHYAGDLARR